MLLLGSRLKDLAVMSLQTGGELARTRQPVIDPGTLTIVAYTVEGPLLGAQSKLLRIADTRELSDMGLIIDSIDELVTSDDVIKLRELIDIGFKLEGMKVIDSKRHTLGKVSDYNVDTNTFTVVQLTVKRPLLKRLNDTELLVHRSQIIEINDDAIIIHSEAKVPEHTRLTTPGAYVNPFRKDKPAAESINLGTER